jgi:hypothetical protein
MSAQLALQLWTTLVPRSGSPIQSSPIEPGKPRAGMNLREPADPTRPIVAGYRHPVIHNASKRLHIVYARHLPERQEGLAAGATA